MKIVVISLRRNRSKSSVLGISAGLIYKSVNHQAYEKAFRNGIVVYSPSIIIEFESVFLRKKFDRYLSIQKRKYLIDIFKNDAYQVTPKVAMQECNDPKDDKYLELAVAVNATCIISGDKD